MLSFTTMAVTEEEATAYAGSRGLDALGWYYDAAALRRAQDYIAGVYNARWVVEFDNATAPDEVKYAIVEASMREVIAPGSLAPDVVPGQVEKRVKVDAVEVEFASSSGAADQRPVLSIVEALLSGLIRPVNSPLFGIAVV